MILCQTFGISTTLRRTMCARIEAFFVVARLVVRTIGIGFTFGYRRKIPKLNNSQKLWVSDFNNFTYVYSIELVDRRPNQMGKCSADDVEPHGIRHDRCMDCVERMDFGTLDWCRPKWRRIHCRWYNRAFAQSTRWSNWRMDRQYSRLDTSTRPDDFQLDIRPNDRMDCHLHMDWRNFDFDKFPTSRNHRSSYNQHLSTVLKTWAQH